VSLLLGAAGFISTYFIHDQYLLAVSFLLIGCAWAAMLALPFALLTNALSGKSLGSYMGLFNCTICLPQIVASLVGGVLFMTFGGKDVYLEVPVADEAKVEVVAEKKQVKATIAPEMARNTAINMYPRVEVK
jgi:MFS family permease